MARIQLRLYVDPGQADVFLNIKRKSGDDTTLTAVVDTGAETTTLPVDLLDEIEYRIKDTVTIDQAGIAGQSFEAIEAIITVSFEDQMGNRTRNFEITAWFTETSEVLVGFEDVLDRAVLHIDMLHTRSGYLEFADS